MKFIKEQIQAEYEAIIFGSLLPKDSPVWNQWIDYPDNSRWMCDCTVEQIINDFQVNGDLIAGINMAI